MDPRTSTTWPGSGGDGVAVVLDNMNNPFADRDNAILTLSTERAAVEDGTNAFEMGTLRRFNSTALPYRPYRREMARVRSFRRTTGTSKVHPTEVDAEWSVVNDLSGRLVKISTYGSDTRKGSGVSQTLQFDEEQARALVRAIEATFPSRADESA
jgi:hypothetical protein